VALVRALTILGLIVAAFGILFMLQGLGYVHWPRDSFMLDQHVWVVRGAGTAVLGLGCVLLARQLARRQR
jgi:hypothetical protein